ncbi:DUF1488 domain-containing protein [Providencia vermicola]|uniref:DUF1488 domain-containing protein n=1 Tax=Providencia vermicola TaxID=333965 RepID=UPI001CEC71ED|nr:DUF1488 domain-containing protein [Providencia vermicola]
MNQLIQFPDREEWDESSEVVRFPVLISGLLAECTISQALLLQRYGEQETALVLFQQNRWDIEEEFEALIAQGFDDENGIYVLSEDK